RRDCSGGTVRRIVGAGRTTTTGTGRRRARARARAHFGLGLMSRSSSKAAGAAARAIVDSSAVESLKRYSIDPDDPRAPSEGEWAQLSEHERRWIVDHLPSELPPSELAPPEGDVHYNHVRSVRDALRGFFRRTRRKMYIGSTLPVYYPGERMFSVDALAVLDVEDGPRNSWVVSAEGRGLDFALEIHWLGHRAKDFERNVAWFPRPGIAEYFVF